MSDSLMRSLAELPGAEPDGRRSEYITRRCHARLAHQVRGSLVSRLRLIGARAVPVWQPSIAVLALVYLVEVIRFALEVYGLA